MDLFEGFILDPPIFSSLLRITSSPSSLGIFVYRAPTSRVPIMLFSSSVSSSEIFRPMSLIFVFFSSWDFMSFTYEAYEV